MTTSGREVPSGGVSKPEPEVAYNPYRLAGDIASLHRAVHEGMPDWQLWTREMRAVLAALPVDSTYKRVCEALGVDHESFKANPAYESFKRVCEIYYRTGLLPKYQHTSGVTRVLTFRDIGTQLRLEQALLANARMSLMDDIGKTPIATRQAATSGGFDSTMMYEIRKISRAAGGPQPPRRPAQSTGDENGSQKAPPKRAPSIGIRTDLRNVEN